MRLLPFLFVFSISQLFAQPNYDWAQNMASFTNIVTIDAQDNGEIIVYGQTLNGTLSVAKLDSQRNVIWSKQIPGLASQRGKLLTVDNEGNIFITGGFFGAINIEGINLYPNTGSCAAFVCKYNASGNLLWAKSIFGSDGQVEGRSIDCDALGNVVVGGDFQSSEVTSDGISASRLPGFYPANDYLIKYDPDGTPLWIKNVGILKNSVCDFQLDIDDQNDIYITTGAVGDTLVFANDTLINPYSQNYAMILAKFNGQGDKIWAETIYGLNSYSGAYGISVVSDNLNNVYVGGVIYGQTSAANSSDQGEGDGFIVKYDSSGNLQWINTLGTNAHDEFVAVAVDGNQNVFGSGYSNSPYMSFQGNLYGNAAWVSSNIFLAKYNSSGSAEWFDMLGGDGTDQPLGLSADNQNSIYLTGFAQSGSISVGQHLLINVTRPFIAKINQFDALSLGEVNEVEINLFPNPSHGSIEISISEQLLGSTLAVSDINGKMMCDNILLSSTQTPIYLDGLKQGVYFVTIIQNENALLKERIVLLDE